MEITANKISEAFNRFKLDSIYINYDRNMWIYTGETATVFYPDVLRRVNLEYMGAVNEGCIKYDVCDDNNVKYGSVNARLSDLVVGNNSLGSVTILYAELGSKGMPTVSVDESKEDFIDRMKMDENISRGLVMQSHGGRFLYKGVIKDKKFSYYLVRSKDYFPVYDDINPSEVIAYVIYYEDKELINKEENKTLKVEIYTEGRTEYKKISSNGKEVSFVKYDDDLSAYDLKPLENEEGYYDEYDSWSVQEVTNTRDGSDYTDDLVRINRELVIGDTITSQTFDKIMNPLLQIPEDATEIDEQGNSRVRLDQRVVVMGQNSTQDIKQVQLQSKIEEWKAHKQDHYQNLYKGTGTNETAFGLITNGSGESSGESKKRSMERTISTVESKRIKIYSALEKIYKYGYKRVHGSDLDIEIQGQDIISLSKTEKMAIAALGYEKGVMSLPTAVEFTNISSNSFEEEVAEVKGEPLYKSMEITNLTTLGGYTRNEDINKAIEDQTVIIANEILNEV